MKNSILKYASLGIVGAALAWLGGNAQAQIVTNLFTFDSATDVNSWASWQADLTLTFDSTQDHTGDGGGSMYWYLTTEASGNGGQCFNDWWNNPYYYPPGQAGIDLSTATNISMWVKWDTTYSTWGINDFNTQDFTIPSGNGDRGIAVGIQVGTGQLGGQGTVVGNALFPDAASNGWAQVNIPIPAGTIAGTNGYGVSLFKWDGSATNGVFAFWIDDIQAEYPGAQPQEVLKNLAPPAPQGLNIYDDGVSGDRQSIETVVTAGNGLNYGWVTNGSPVTYSLNIAQGPPVNYLGGQVHMMILPGTGITELAPDWNESNAMVLFLVQQTNGIIADLRYKLNQPSGNSWLYGTDTNVFGGGGLPFTNTIVAGYGGLLCAVTNATGYVGTWAVKMTSATQGQLIYPGGTAGFAFPQLSDAQAFTGPVTVYWGVQPNNPGWFQDAVLNNVSISGSLNTLNMNLAGITQLNPSLMSIVASKPSLVFFTPANAEYWLQWSPPNPAFALQSASSLNGAWSDVQGVPLTVTNLVNTFDTSNFLSNVRNYNPPPIAISYDFGDDASPNINWVPGPTYDAGGSAASGSAQLQWTFAGGSGNQAFVFDLFPSGQSVGGGTLSFDIMIDPSSAAGTNNDYGYLNVITRDESYTWDPTPVAEPLLTAAGGNVGTWAHVSVPLNGTNSVVRAIDLQISNDGNISTTQTIYVDNLTITSLTGSTPPVYNINGVSSSFITSPMLPSSGAGFFRLSKP